MTRSAHPLLTVGLALGALASCAQGPPTTPCEAPTPRELVYPFTGVWSATEAGPPHMCLYQQDARTVRGWINRNQVLGTITPDGFLVIVGVHEAATTIYVLRLLADTLTSEYTLSSEPDALLPNPGTTWRRNPVEEARPK